MSAQTRASTRSSSGGRRRAPAADRSRAPEPAADRTREPAADRGQGVRRIATFEDTSVLTGEEMTAWRAFLAASLGVTARLNHELEAAADISLHEYEILVRLSEATAMSMRMSALAERVSHSRSRLTHTVARLEKKGYVRRRSCASDRRGVVAELTEEGLAFLRRVASVHLAGVRRHVIDRVPAEHRAAFTAMMSALADDPDSASLDSSSAS